MSTDTPLGVQYQQAIDELRRIGQARLDDPAETPVGRAITHIRLDAIKDVEQVARMIQEDQ